MHLPPREGKEDGIRRRDSRPLFHENNVADWDLVGLKPKRHHRPAAEGGRGHVRVNGSVESHEIAREAKPSLFHETNAVHQKKMLTRGTLDHNNVVDAQIDNYVVAQRGGGETKPSLFQETNAAIQHFPKFSATSRIDAITIDNFANAADVKENDISRRNSIMGQDRRNDFNDKDLLHGSETMSNSRHQGTRRAMRHDLTMSNAREVDAAMSIAQRAWDYGSLRIPQQQRDALVDRSNHSSPYMHGYDGVDATRFRTPVVAAANEDDRFKDDTRSDQASSYTTDKSVISDQAIHKNGSNVANVKANSSVGSVIDDGSVDYYNTNARKIFITERALELARSLKFEVGDIFQFKANELQLDLGSGGVDIESATVNENDVREYLDRKYEQLINMMNSSNVDQRHALRTRTKTNNNDRRNMTYGSDSKTFGPKRIEDSFEWMEEESPLYESNLRPRSQRNRQQQRLQQQQQQQQQQLQIPNSILHKQHVNFSNPRDDTAQVDRRTDWMNRRRSDDEIISTNPNWNPRTKFMNP